MAIRNSFRSRRAVLLCTSLAACSAPLGCNVYDDELLRRSDDAENPTKDGSIALDGASKDGAPLEAGPPGDRGAGMADTVATDTPSWGDSWTRPESGVADGTVADAPRSPEDDGGTKPDGGTFDARTIDATTDSFIGSRDADAASPGADATPRPDAAIDVLADAMDARIFDAGTFDAAPDVDGATAPPTFRVIRVGDGTMSLSASSAPAFVEERSWDGTLIGTAIALPVASSGPQNAFTLSGIASSEGALSLSLDGRFLSLTGYAASPGRSSIADTMDVERVVARIDAAGSVDTTTRLDDVFAGANTRSAVSVDGASFWVSGSSGGVWYFPFGVAPGTQIVDTPDNVRLVGLFGDQLYGTSGASPMTTVFAVGSGLPTNGKQSVAALAGMPRSGMSPYAFALFDRDPQIAGLDTLYLTDDRSPESDGSGGGVQKWTYDGIAWSRAATFAAVGGGRASFRGLTGMSTTTAVTLVATTADSGTNRLVVFVDDGSPSAVGTVVATAPANTMFRGVALSPRP